MSEVRLEARSRETNHSSRVEEKGSPQQSPKLELLKEGFKVCPDTPAQLLSKGVPAQLTFGFSRQN